MKKQEKIKKRVDSIIEYNSGTKGHHMGAFAAQSSFFILLAIFPIINILIYLTSILPFSREQVIAFVTRIIPGESQSFFIGVINSTSNSSKSFTIVSVIIAIWSASKAIMAVRNELNEIYNSREERNYFVIRAISALYTVIFIVILILLLVLKVFGNDIARQIVSVFPAFDNIVRLIISIRSVVMYIILFGFFWLIHTKLPNRKLKFKTQLPGAIFATLAWALITELYSIYARSPWGKTATYGSLTNIIFMMFWLYFGVFAIFIGGQINQYLYEEKKK